MTTFQQGQMVHAVHDLGLIDGDAALGILFVPAGCVGKVVADYGPGVAYDVEFVTSEGPTLRHISHLSSIAPFGAEAAAELPGGTYAIVELMGHQQMVGRVSEVRRFGVDGIQVEPIHAGQMLPPVWRTGAALYGVTPCTPERAWEIGQRTYGLPDAVRKGPNVDWCANHGNATDHQENG